jgi:hypothetical protein
MNAIVQNYLKNAVQKYYYWKIFRIREISALLSEQQQLLILKESY